MQPTLRHALRTALCGLLAPSDLVGAVNGVPSKMHVLITMI